MGSKKKGAKKSAQTAPGNAPSANEGSPKSVLANGGSSSPVLEYADDAAIGSGKSPPPLPQAALEAVISGKERELATVRTEVRVLTEQVEKLKAEKKDLSNALGVSKQTAGRLKRELAESKQSEEVATARCAAASGQMTMLCCAGAAAAALAAAGGYFMARRTSA